MYICPAGAELLNVGTMTNHGHPAWKYRTASCSQGCTHRHRCTHAKQGRTIIRRKNEHVIDNLKERLKEFPDLTTLRKQIVEPVFGIIKRAMNQSYLLLRGTEKVEGELSLTMLAYNIRRVINIVGIPRMIAALTS